MSPPLIAIFGAAVLRDGRPSPALLRRIGYGLAAATAQPAAQVFCSGGIGRAGPSEASVMARALSGAGIADGRLVLDEASLDTLQSAVAVAAWIRNQGASRVIVCSDGYHIPRIRLLLGALGVSSLAGPMEGGRGGLGHRVRMTLREGLAIPYDLAIVLTRRGRLIAAGPGS